MTLIKHELRQSRNSFLIWTASVGLLMAMCVLLYSEMKTEMNSMGDMFASMGSFSQAFGLDQLNFGTFIGYYAIECGNVLGLGGAFFAALCASAALTKEERDHTAEFLLTHPISRARIVTDKLIAVFVQIVLLNVVVFAISIGCTLLIGEAIPFKELGLLHAAYLLLQLELAGICFGISAFMRRGSSGVGLGIATMMYFLNLVANISASAEPLRYFTPFAYADASKIVATGSLDATLVGLGIGYGVIGIALAYAHYCRKDIH